MSSTALKYAIDLLARREHSEYEIRCKMLKKAFSASEIEYVINYCKQKKWQSDKQLCEHYLSYRSRKGFGLNRIKQELRIKGVSHHIIADVINNNEINWDNIVLSQLSKKFPQYQQANDIKSKQKIWQYMLGRGFSLETFSYLFKK